MLQLDPKKRPTAAKILLDPVFKQVIKDINLLDGDIDLRPFLNWNN